MEKEEELILKELENLKEQLKDRNLEDLKRKTTKRKK